MSPHLLRGEDSERYIWTMDRLDEGLVPHDISISAQGGHLKVVIKGETQ